MYLHGQGGALVALTTPAEDPAAGPRTEAPLPPAAVMEAPPSWPSSAVNAKPPRGMILASRPP
eukprot:1055835-Alexandrium_andersonii.AAC.1